MKNLRDKIKFFWSVFVKSLTKFDYYKELSKTKFTFSLKYLFFLFFIISLLTSIILSTSLSLLALPNLPKIINSIESKASSLYPDKLVVNIKDGKVTTNQKEPYYLDTLNGLGLPKGFDHIVTIDTNADVGSIKNYNTAVLVTKDSVVAIDKDNTYKIYPIDSTANYTIDKKGYDKVISQIKPYLQFVRPVIIALAILIILVGPFIGAGFSLLGELIYLLIFAGFFFLIVKLMKKSLTYKKIYQLAMHAATLPILLGLAVSLLGIQMPFLLGTAILTVFMILVVNKLS